MTFRWPTLFYPFPELHNYLQRKWYFSLRFTLRAGSHLVPLKGECEEGEHADADSEGGGEGVDAAVQRTELPGAVTVYR